MSDNVGKMPERRVPEVQHQPDQSPEGPSSSRQRLERYTRLLISQPRGSERNLGKSPDPVTILQSFNASSAKIMDIMDIIGTNVVSTEDLDKFQKILHSVGKLPSPTYKAEGEQVNQLAEYKQQSEELLKDFHEKYIVSHLSQRAGVELAKAKLASRWFIDAEYKILNEEQYKNERDVNIGRGRMEDITKDLTSDAANAAYEMWSEWIEKLVPDKWRKGEIKHMKETIKYRAGFGSESESDS